MGLLGFDYVLCGCYEGFPLKALFFNKRKVKP